MKFFVISDLSVKSLNRFSESDRQPSKLWHMVHMADAVIDVFHVR